MGERTLFLGSCIWDGCVCRTGTRPGTGRRSVCADIRFLNRVDASGECWTWPGQVNAFGYGQLPGRPPRKHIILAHIYSWRRCGYLYDSAAVLRHSCDNRRCVRPDHLELGTPQDNIDDAWGRGRMRPRGRVLDATKVRAIRHARAVDGISYQELADRFGVAFTTIARVCTGRTWKEVALWHGDSQRAWKCCGVRFNLATQEQRCGGSATSATWSPTTDPTPLGWCARSMSSATRASISRRSPSTYGRRTTRPSST